MGNNRKFTVIAVAAAFAALAGYNLVGRGFVEGQNAARSELRKIEDETAKTREKFPDIKAQEKELAGLQKSYDSVLKDIAAYEKKIPSAASVSKLLGEMTRRSEGLGMDFESIRQDIEREKEGYIRLKLDIKFSGPYSSVVNYLNRLQGLSDYLVVSDVEISQSKDGALHSKTNMRVSMLLLEKGADLAAFENARIPEIINLRSDPFVSKKPGKKDKAGDFKLSGITLAGDDSTAIINDEVVRIGAKTGGWEVSRISADAVTLTDGNDTVTVTLNR